MVTTAHPHLTTPVTNQTPVICQCQLRHLCRPPARAEQPADTFQRRHMLRYFRCRRSASFSSQKSTSNKSQPHYRGSAMLQNNITRLTLSPPILVKFPEESPLGQCERLRSRVTWI
ncbi:hypothetical protein JZ751_029214 [Albula glossodonta]|uniref:Uncharacterized protein n=1 Tax=Albula glossodonta TaxID=121402 RepID=A0A8T2PJ42_9TELE|nr:hypothetical protein JZ751_029214 [Albula glossodonta]